MVSDHEQPRDYRIFVLIPARGGSKGVPGKALKMLGGKPLIAHTIEHALSLGPHAVVHVNTDDPEIREVALKYGADVPFLRPGELAGDHSDLVEAVRHASRWYREHQGYAYDISIIMSPTNPFRKPCRVKDALLFGLDHPDIFNIGSVGPVNHSPDNYWVKDQGGYRRLSGVHSITANSSSCVQSSMSFNIVYEFRTDNHKRTPVILTEIEAIDIDEPRDLALARAVVQAGLCP